MKSHESSSGNHHLSKRARMAGLWAAVPGTPAILLGSALAPKASAESFSDSAESPQAFIQNTTHQLSAMVQFAQKHNIGLTFPDGDSTVYVFVEKNPQNPKEHDMFQIVTDKNSRLTTTSGAAQITENYEGFASKKSRGDSSPYSLSMLGYNQNEKADNPVPENSMELAVGISTQPKGNVYLVGTPDAKDMFMQTYRQHSYNSDPDTVSSQYKKFIAHGKSIMSHSLGKTEVLNFLKTHGGTH